VIHSLNVQEFLYDSLASFSEHYKVNFLAGFLTSQEVALYNVFLGMIPQYYENV